MMMNGTISNSLINDSSDVYNGNDTLARDPLKYGIYLNRYLIVIHSLAFLLGATGNGLVIWFCLFRMEKTINVIWFLNLSIADFTFAVILPLIITQIALDYQWPFGNFMCKFIWFVFYLNMAISVLQLTVISVDRCLCVVFPVWCRNHRTKRLALIVLLIIWVISIVLTLPSYIFRHTDIIKDKIYCRTFSSIKWVSTTRFFLFFLIPFIIIVSSYTVLILRIKDKSIIKSSKPFKIIVAMVIAFFICWFPYHLFVFMRILSINYVYGIGGKIALSFMLFNCCINPILYVFIGQDFKQKFCDSFQAIFEKVFMEEMDRASVRIGTGSSLLRWSRATATGNIASTAHVDYCMELVNNKSDDRPGLVLQEVKDL